MSQVLENTDELTQATLRMAQEYAAAGFVSTDKLEALWEAVWSYRRHLRMPPGNVQQLLALLKRHQLLPPGYTLEEIEVEYFPPINPRRLVQARKMKGLTQQQIADKVGVHNSAVGYWEQGKNLMYGQKIRIIAEMTGKTYTWLTAWPEEDQEQFGYFPEKILNSVLSAPAPLLVAPKLEIPVETQTEAVLPEEEREGIVDALLNMAQEMVESGEFTLNEVTPVAEDLEPLNHLPAVVMSIEEISPAPDEELFAVKNGEARFLEEVLNETYGSQRSTKLTAKQLLAYAQYLTHLERDAAVSLMRAKQDREENLKLREENERLREENAELRRTHTQIKEEASSRMEELAALFVRLP